MSDFILPIAIGLIIGAVIGVMLESHARKYFTDNGERR